MMTQALRLLAAIAFGALPFAAPSASAAGNDVAVKVDRDGNTFTVAAEFTVAAPPDLVWDVLIDFDNMARILSNVDASKIVNREGNKFEVVQKSHTQAGLLKLSLDSTRAVELTPKQEIRSHLVKGDLKSSDFSTKMAEEAGGMVKVTISGKFVTQGLASAAVTPETVQAQTKRQYQELKDEILRRKNHEPTPPCILAKNCEKSASSG